MTEPAKKSPIRRANLKLVQPNIEEMDRVLQDMAANMAPMIKRSSSTRSKFEMDLKVLEGDRAAVEDRISLVQKHYEALMKGFNAELDDIDKAMGLYTGGLTQDKIGVAS